MSGLKSETEKSLMNISKHLEGRLEVVITKRETEILKNKRKALEDRDHLNEYN